ncbi:MAG: molybdopterin-dependent oxidoreductase [Chloroflexi bacterium]|nr:molybdopterin-dependent oxidoreductase [Chloroflexota bacterium]
MAIELDALLRQQMEPTGLYGQAEAEVVRTVCQSCHCGCGVLVHLREGRIIKIEGNPEHPLNEGIICPKGMTSWQVVYHPDRLKYPLKRAGARGENRWQRISWDEALDTIAEKLKDILKTDGPMAIAGTFGGKPTRIRNAMHSLINSLGSPNSGYSDASFCWGPYPVAEVNTYGGYTFTEMNADARNSNCIIVWGGNPTQSHPTYGRLISNARARGAKLVVVDPRFTAIASKADVWLQVRPGTDAALALGMLNVIINEGLYDKEFVDRWCLGFEELKERVQQYPVEKVAEITWVPAEDIVRVARMYASTRPATIYARVAVETHLDSTQGMRALACLVAVTGNIDVKGGNVFSVYPRGFYSFHGQRRKWWREKANGDAEQEQRLGAREFPLLCGPNSPIGSPHPTTMVRSVLTGKPYPIKAWFVANNLLLCLPNSSEVYQALKKVDFLVVWELFMTPTAQLADIILPAAHWLETNNIMDAYSNYIAARPRAIEPVGEAWDEMKIVFEILDRVGKEFCYFPARNADEYDDNRLKGLGMTFNDLKEMTVLSAPIPYKRYEQEGFQTPSGKVELYSGTFEKYGYDPLPHYVEPKPGPVSTPELARDYPLVLTTGAIRVSYMHSEGRAIPWLRELAPDPEIEIHPDTAAQLGIRQGDWVWIETPNVDGRIKQKARLTSGIDSRVVCCEAHWWFPEKPAPDYGHWEVNINKMLSGDPTPTETGTIVLRGLLCRIYKAEEN